MLAHVISMIIIAVSLRYDARMTELKRVRLNPLKKRHMVGGGGGEGCREVV